MLYVRMASRLLFIRTFNIPKLEAFYSQELDGEVLSFEEALERGNEHCTIIFLTPPYLKSTKIEDATSILFFPHGSSLALSKIFEYKLSPLVEKTQLGPGSMIMRVPKDGEKIISFLKSTYHAKQMDWKSAIEKGEQDATILAFTNLSLYQPMKFSDNIGNPLLVGQPINILYDKLRKDGLLYITKELEDHTWYELKINIYDSSGEYQSHYERLIHVLSQLDIGMILGESWTKDYALALFSVLVYQIHLFTLYPPLKVKEILMGLEYDKEGNRMVDFDLYYKNKKISASQIKAENQLLNKSEKGLYFREKLLKSLPKKSIEYLDSRIKS